MEIVIKISGMETLVNALNNLASAYSGKGTQQSQPMQQIPVQGVPTYQAPVQQPTTQTPSYQAPNQMATPANTTNFATAQTYTPQQSFSTQAPVQQVPTSHVTQSYTQDQLAVAMTALHDAGKLDAVMGALAQFGAETLMQVPKEQYAALATMLRGAGASI